MPRRPHDAAAGWGKEPGRGMQGPGRGVEGAGWGVKGPGRGVEAGWGVKGPGRGVEAGWGVEGPGRGVEGPGRGVEGPGRGGARAGRLMWWEGLGKNKLHVENGRWRRRRASGARGPWRGKAWRGCNACG